MNETLIKRHLYKEAKRGRVIIARIEPDNLVVGDTSHLLSLSDKSQVFDSRKAFPTIPEIGQTFMFSDVFNTDSKPTSTVQNLLDNTFSQTMMRLKITSWHYGAQINDISRCFEGESGLRVFIRSFFLDLLGDPFVYQYFTTGKDRPVIIKDSKDIFAGIIMPYHTFDKDSRNFDILENPLRS